MTCNVTQASHKALRHLWVMVTWERLQDWKSHPLRLLLLAFPPIGKLSLFESQMCFIKNIIKSKN